MCIRAGDALPDGPLSLKLTYVKPNPVLKAYGEVRYWLDCQPPTCTQGVAIFAIADNIASILIRGLHRETNCSRD